LTSEELTDVKNNNLQIIFKGEIVGMNEFVSKYSRGDRFFIHNKLNISKLGEDYVT
jgi:hypothetical protein